MAVTVRLLSSMSPSGRAVVEATTPTTLGGLIEELATLHPEAASWFHQTGGRWRRDVNVFVDETHVRELGGMAAAIEDGAEVLVIPASAGG